jgi:arylsulfatase A
VTAAGLMMPKDLPADGVDLLPYLVGEKSNKPHEWLCWQNRSWIPREAGGQTKPKPNIHNSAIRKGNWKLVRLNEKIGSEASPPAWELYDLKKDIGEQNNVAAAHSEVVFAMSGLFDTWRASMHPTVE